MKMEKKETNISTWISAIIAILSIIISIGVAVYGHFRNEKFSKELASRQEEFEMELIKQGAIPFLRLTENQDSYTTMEIFEPSRELEVIDKDGGDSESYYSILNFSFENMVDNIAIFNHIEYNGVAYELKNQNLLTQKGEIISFSENNKFIGLEFNNILTIVVKTQYDEYYSYECLLNSGDKVGNIRYCTVDSIGMPVKYNIDNEIYKNREIHVRDVYFDIDNIIF